MPTIHFLSHDGSATTVVASAGLTLMEAARQNDVPGILADCGGACACATCQVVVDPAWAAALQPPSELETAMLDLDPADDRAVRLACQIRLSDGMEGMIAHVPPVQGG
jgi:2Fe-2S ferredoxin